jgi:hypothetical protein
MQRGGKLFHKKKLGKKFKKKITALARPRAVRARGGDEATTFTAVEPLRQAPQLRGNK